MPQSPKIELCSHDLPNSSAECYDNQTGQGRSLNINETDDYIMISPDDWGLVLFYIDQLIRRIRSKKVRSELYKIKSTSSKLSSPDA